MIVGTKIFLRKVWCNPDKYEPSSKFIKPCPSILAASGFLLSPTLPGCWRHYTHVMWSYVCFLARNCGSGDHRRIRISVILFVCLGHGGWEDTLMHPHWHAWALLSLEHFPLHTAVSYSFFRSQLGNRILPEPFLAVTTWVSCHISVFPSSCLYQQLMQPVELTAPLLVVLPISPWDRNAVIVPMVPSGPSIEPTIR